MPNDNGKVHILFWLPMILVGYLFIRDALDGGTTKTPSLPDAYERKQAIYQDFLSVVRAFSGKENDINDTSRPPRSINFYIIFKNKINIKADNHVLKNNGWVFAANHLRGFKMLFCKDGVDLGITYSTTAIFLKYSTSNFCYDKIILNGKVYRREQTL